jgi:hypothetical protein
VSEELPCKFGTKIFLQSKNLHNEEDEARRIGLAFLKINEATHIDAVP